jgi:hypothetical protein
MVELPHEKRLSLDLLVVENTYPQDSPTPSPLVYTSRVCPKLTLSASMATQVGIDARRASDVAQLWQSAVEDYEKRTKKRLRLAQFSNVDQIMTGTEGLSNEFENFRHDQSKIDNVRTAFKNNLWQIQKVVNTVQVIGTAASVRLELNSVHGVRFRLILMFDRPFLLQCRPA